MAFIGNWVGFRIIRRKIGGRVLTIPVPAGAQGGLSAAADFRRQAFQKYDLTKAAKCNTLLDMKSATLTIRLDKDLDVLLSKASKRSGRNRSEIAREALRRQLRLQQFEELRKRVMPFAEARGFLTDEDIFSQIS